jgi:hypothetical protein
MTCGDRCQGLLWLGRDLWVLGLALGLFALVESFDRPVWRTLTLEVLVWTLALTLVLVICLLPLPPRWRVFWRYWDVRHQLDGGGLSELIQARGRLRAALVRTAVVGVLVSLGVLAILVTLHVLPTTLVMPLSRWLLLAAGAVKAWDAINAERDRQAQISGTERQMVRFELELGEGRQEGEAGP